MSDSHPSRDAAASLGRAAGLFAFIVLLVVARSLHRWSAVDIHLWDETTYLRNGVELLTRGLPSPDWAPLYAVWYWLESLLIRDRVALYYANWSCLVGLNLVAALLILRRLGAGLLLTVIVLSALAIAGAFEVGLNVPLLASALVGFAVAAALGARTLTRAFATSASIVALAVFVRPELALAFALLLGAALVAAFVERSPGWLAAPAAIALAGCLVFGNPFAGDRNRALTAFGQHYARNVNAAAPLAQRVQHPEITWSHFVFQDFGPARSLSAAAWANPGAFVWHLGQNVVRLVPELAAPVAPAAPGGRLVGWVVLVLIGAGGAAAIRKRDRLALVLSVVAASTLVAEAVGIVLVHPNPHYLSVPVLAVAALGVAGARTWRPPREGVLALGIATVTLLAMPGQASATPWYWPREHAMPPPLWSGAPHGLAVANSLGALAFGDDPSPLVLSEFPDAIVYSSWRARSRGLARCPRLEQCIGAIGAAIIDDGFVEFYVAARDPVLPQLLANPADLGFTVGLRLAPNIVLVARPGVLSAPP